MQNEGQLQSLLNRLDDDLARCEDHLREAMQAEAEDMCITFKTERDAIAKAIRERGAQSSKETFCKVNLRHSYEPGGTHAFLWVTVFHLNGKTRSRYIKKPKGVAADRKLTHGGADEFLDYSKG